MGDRIRLAYSNEKSLYIAGTRWAEYAENVKTWFHAQHAAKLLGYPALIAKHPLQRRLHVLADFLIGAHALTQANCIISRDLGIYKTHFKDLNVVNSV